MSSPYGYSIKEINNERLIEEIKARPPLYDRSLKEYSDMVLKRSLWEEIYVKLFPDTWHEMSDTQREVRGAEIIKRWNNLRTCFTRELKIMKDPLQNKRRKYIYFNQLLFLIDHITVNLTETEASFVFKNNSPDQFENECEQSQEQSRSPVEVNAKEIRRKRKIKTSTTKEKKNENIEKYVQYSMNKLREEFTYKNSNDAVSIETVPRAYGTDADTNFALSIVPMLKNIPVNKKIDAHIELLSVLKKYTSQAEYSIVKLEKDDELSSEVDGDDDSDVMSTRSIFADEN